LKVGRRCRKELVDTLENQSVLIVTTLRGRKQIRQDEFLSNLPKTSDITWVDGVTENPGLDFLQGEIASLKGKVFDAVLAFGGGSAMDAAKALKVALSPGCQDYELGELLQNPKLHQSVQTIPLYAVPTTAGTGSEVTPFATVWNHEIKKKLSLAGVSVFPYAAYVDAEMTDSLPMAVTISTGLDAINQAAESIWNKNANSISIAYASRALQLGFEALPRLASGKGGQVEREQMAEASVLAGLAISHTRTALCHSMSYPMTAHFGVPHGLACAFTMPAVLRCNLQAEDGRFAQLAQILTGKADLESLVQRFDDLHQTLDVCHRVKSQVTDLDALLALKEEMYTPGRADNNLSDEIDLEKVINESWAG
jgi:alcohol dehydrogenase